MNDYLSKIELFKSDCCFFEISKLKKKCFFFFFAFHTYLRKKWTMLKIKKFK